MDKAIFLIELCQGGEYAFIVSDPEHPEFQLWDIKNKVSIDKKSFSSSGRLTSFNVIDTSTAIIECRDMTMKWSQEKGFYDISKRVYINEAEWELAGREYYEPSRTSPDGYRRFIWSDDRKILQIMDVTRNQIIASIKHTGPVIAAAFHPYGRLILWAGGDNFLYLWNLESEKIVTKLQTKGIVTACAVTEEELIICGDSLGYVYLVETPPMPGRIKNNPSSGKTAGEHVCEMLNIMGEKKDKLTDFVKEKMGSAKDVTGFVKGKIDSAKDVISNKIRPWKKKADE